MPNGSTIIYDTKDLIVQPNVITRQTLKTTQNITISPLKRRRATKRSNDEMDSVTIKTEEKDESSNELNNNKAQVLISETFWDSPEAKCWFGCGETNKIVENTFFTNQAMQANIRNSKRVEKYC